MRNIGPMADDSKKKDSYMSQVAHFYFAPELRSVATILYLGIFGYFTLYYVDNLFLAIKFLVYVILGHTALSGTAFLFTGLAFVIFLVLPFFVSFYSIFVLHKIWHKPEWAMYAKAIVTALIIVGSLLIIVISDGAARAAARHDVMRSFVEDANLTGKI
jgi:hypothetical protein